MRFYRKLWVIAAVAANTTCTGVALLAFTLGTLFWAALISALVAGAAGILSSTRQELGDPLPRTGSSLACGAYIGVATMGAGEAVGPVGVLFVLAWVVASPPVVEWLYARMAGAKSSEPAHMRDARAPASVHPPRQWTHRTSPASDMTDQELIFMWRLSFVQITGAQSTADVFAACENRARLLDEIERRDPVGFCAWMNSGARAASDPSRFLGLRPGTDKEDRP